VGLLESEARSTANAALHTVLYVSKTEEPGYITILYCTSCYIFSIVFSIQPARVCEPGQLGDFATSKLNMSCTNCNPGFAWDGKHVGAEAVLADKKTYVVGNSEDTAILLVADTLYPSNPPPKQPTYHSYR
jgi:hypothetical protein